MPEPDGSARSGFGMPLVPTAPIPIVLGRPDNRPGGEPPRPLIAQRAAVLRHHPADSQILADSPVIGRLRSQPEGWRPATPHHSDEPLPADSADPERVRHRLVEQVAFRVEGDGIGLSVAGRVRGPGHDRVHARPQFEVDVETRPGILELWLHRGSYAPDRTAIHALFNLLDRTAR